MYIIRGNCTLPSAARCAAPPAGTSHACTAYGGPKAWRMAVSAVFDRVHAHVVWCTMQDSGLLVVSRFLDGLPLGLLCTA